MQPRTHLMVGRAAARRATSDSRRRSTHREKERAPPVARSTGGATYWTSVIVARAVPARQDGGWCGAEAMGSRRGFRCPTQSGKPRRVRTTLSIGGGRNPRCCQLLSADRRARQAVNLTDVTQPRPSLLRLLTLSVRDSDLVGAANLGLRHLAGRRDPTARTHHVMLRASKEPIGMPFSSSGPVPRNPSSGSPAPRW